MTYKLSSTFSSRIKFAILLATLSRLPVQAQNSVSIAFNGTGLSMLRYSNTDYLAYGDLRLNQVELQSENGSITLGSVAGSVLIDSAKQVQSRTYPWGRVSVSYTTAGNRLNLGISVINTSISTIKGIWLEPIGLHLPSAPKEYDGNTPLLIDTLNGPALQSLSTASGVVVVSADDVTKPLQIGFPWALDKPSNVTFPVSVNTDRVFMFPDSVPTISRPIPPGGQDQYNISIRFGTPGSTTTNLGGDTISSFTAAYPQTLNWPDRRPIGMIIMATSAAGWRTNPRGYFLDSSIDVSTPAGVQAFQRRVLDYARNSVAVLKGMNAQGMVTWDIEGEQYPQPNGSYVCDPSQLDQLAPEMAGIADQYFKTFSDSGLKVGVCIRPQQFKATGATATQTSIPDPTQLMIQKVQYAKKRWGATLFYVDSNVVSDTDSNPISPDIFATLQRTFPDSLFIPEHSRLKYWAYTAPYKELAQNYTGTAASVRAVYPNAFTVVNIENASLTSNFNTLVSSVQQGDTLMFRGWFDDQPTNSLVANIYKAAGTVAVAVSPSSATVQAGNSLQLAAAVSGTASTGVVWSLPDGGPGTIAATGLYSAPASVSGTQTVLARVTSLADPTKSATATITVTPASSLSSTIRVNAGGPAFTDNTGTTWAADNGFTGGAVWSTGSSIGNSALYQTLRYGNFTYVATVPNGAYTVTLKFAEVYFTSTGQRVFQVIANGQTVLNGFDIVAAAGGASRAVDRAIPITVTNGRLSLEFISQVDYAQVNAIEVKPVTTAPAPSANRSTVRINAGGGTVVDSAGLTWADDAPYAIGGSKWSTTGAVPQIYQDVRFGNFSYQIPLPADTYVLTLKFAELYFSSAGQRRFNVVVNGQTVLSNFDVVAAAGGSGKMVDIPVQVTTSGSPLTIQFVSLQDYASIAALEVVPAAM